MKCENHFSGKSKRNIIILSSTEFAGRVVKVKTVLSIKNMCHITSIDHFSYCIKYPTKKHIWVKLCKLSFNFIHQLF